MPSSGTLNSERIIAAVENGVLDEAVLDEGVDNVVDLIIKSKPALEKDFKYDVEAHHAVARKVAEGSMVLLKNDDNILPLKSNAKIAVIGEMAKAPRYQGAGSSVINPTKLDNAYDSLIELGADVTYAQGYYKAPPTKKDKNRKSESELTAEAVKAAEAADVALVFIGLTEEFEAEGYDRDNIDMPAAHNALVSEVVKANPNTVVVLAGGSVVNMPWIEDVKALLNMGLSGQAGGSAAANILMGKVNPSGKTAETYPLSFDENPVYGNYPGSPVISEHKESIYIGYRYYDTAKKNVLFPFGFGLSYTTFEYSDIKLSESEIKDNETVTVSFKIKNTGDMDGAEIAQVYVADKESTIFRPEKELRAFTKVFIKAGEEKEVSVTLGKRAFAYYNTNIGDWHVETGEFAVLVGSSSRDIRLEAAVNVISTVEAEIPDYKKSAPAYYTADIAGMNGGQWAAVYGQQLPSAERDTSAKITIYNCLDDASHTKWGGRIGRLIQSVITKFASAETGDGAMLQAMAVQIPMRNFISMSMGVFSPKMAEGLLQILNDDESTFKGVCKILGGVPTALFKLPNLIHSI